jgi:hypothetical protein
MYHRLLRNTRFTAQIPPRYSVLSIGGIAVRHNLEDVQVSEITAINGILAEKWK